jgi:hypothetical protein
VSDPLEPIVRAAEEEGGARAASLRPPDERRADAPWAALCGARHAAGVEAIYEGYLLHYGRSRLFAPPTPADALLLGDELYARGLVWIAELDDVEAVAALADLIALASRARVADADGDVERALWAATSAYLADRALARDLASAKERLRRAGDGGPLRELAARVA